jgi:hypothetical protein
LPAAFIHHDLTFKFPNNYWTVEGKDGNKIPRPTYGMAVMYSPFFFVGHIIAKNTGYRADGYSLPYKWCLHIGSFLYALLGLWFCRKNLLLFFNETITFITLICIFLGTNLFYYTFAWGEMSHSYLFCIFSIYIYYVLRWFQLKKKRYLFIFSFLAGFAVLIRPTDVVILLFPVLYGVVSLNDLKQRYIFILNQIRAMLTAIFIFLLPILVQLIYWKTYSGSWTPHTYPEKEGFFFSDPKVYNFLFSFRKGWFIYTPLMLFSLIGILLLWKTAKEWLWFSIALFCVNVYVLSSWWDWGFGGSFGCRAIIQHYAFFAIGFASFVSFIFSFAKKNKILNRCIQAVICLAFLLLIRLNYVQSWKYKYELIHYNGMTKEAYFYVFNRSQLSPEELKEYQKLIKSPDFDKMLDGTDRDQ